VIPCAQNANQSKSVGPKYLVVLVAVLFVYRYTLMNLVFVGKAVVDSNGLDASFHSTAA
jgi:hypothetical protein